MKALQNDISQCESETLNKWIEKSPEKKAEFDQMKKLWNDMDSVSINPPTVNVKKEWAFFEKKLNAVQISSQNESNILDKLIDKFTNIIPVPKYMNWKPVYAIATILILIVSSVLIYQNIGEKEIRFQTFTAANKQKVNVQLSDGSSIKLNSGSSITVQDEFADDKREVRLIGEAYFDVAKEKRPCIILTDNAKIKVLGTSFNVWSRNNQTRVVVKEGMVRLSSLKSENDFVIIQADQMSRIIEDRNHIEVNDIQAERFIGWPEGKLVFEHCSLGEFVDEIERQYNVIIKLESDNMKDLKLTGIFDNLTIEQVLSSVCLTFNFDYEIIDQSNYLIHQK